MTLTQKPTEWNFTTFQKTDCHQSDDKTSRCPSNANSTNRRR